MSTIQGACYCGAIRYEFETPGRFSIYCHCSECRRASGAPIVAWMGVPDARFKVLLGEELISTYADPPEAPEAIRQFCSRCGSQLFFRGDRWKGEVHITTATMRDGQPPTAHVYYSDRAPWFEMTDELPKRGGKTGVEPI